MNCSMPGLPIHHQLPEFIQTHVHRVSDAIQPSHPLSSPSPPAPNPPSIRVFSSESTLCMRWPKTHWNAFDFLPCGSTLLRALFASISLQGLWPWKQLNVNWEGFGKALGITCCVSSFLSPIYLVVCFFPDIPFSSSQSPFRHFIIDELFCVSCY